MADQAEPTNNNSEIIKVAFACFIGTTIEWYDFFLYGTAAAIVFGHLFFPTFEPLSGVLMSLGTYAVGFIARPIGGAVFGHYGDRLGRRVMLSLSLLLMGSASFCIGLLPTYDSIGVLAPCLLIVLRVIQGFGIGGEWGGAVVLAVEHAPAQRRGLFGSLPQVGVPAGLMLGSGMFALVSLLPSDQVLAWAWRVPFLLSVVLVAIGLFVRLRIAESPAFLKLKRESALPSAPLLEVLRNSWREVLIAMGARLAENAFFYVYTVFIIVYASSSLAMSKESTLKAIMLGSGAELLTIPLFGLLSDYVGRRPVYLFGAIFSAVFAFPFFMLAGSGIYGSMPLALFLGLAVGHAAMYGPQASFFSELFGASVRYSGASLGYQFASVFAGGLSPLIATSILSYSHGKPWLVASYMLALALVTITALIIAKETRVQPAAPTD